MKRSAFLSVLLLMISACLHQQTFRGDLLEAVNPNAIGSGENIAAFQQTVEDLKELYDAEAEMLAKQIIDADNLILNTIKAYPINDLNLLAATISLGGSVVGLVDSGSFLKLSSAIIKLNIAAEEAGVLPPLGGRSSVDPVTIEGQNISDTVLEWYFGMKEEVGVFNE
eukprot:gene21253-28170_t